MIEDVTTTQETRGAICARCGVRKPFAAFRRKPMTDGTLGDWCTECFTAFPKDVMTRRHSDVIVKS
jgi:hypothetical protein